MNKVNKIVNINYMKKIYIIMAAVALSAGLFAQTQDS